MLFHINTFNVNKNTGYLIFHHINIVVKIMNEKQTREENMIISWGKKPPGINYIFVYIDGVV